MRYFPARLWRKQLLSILLLLSLSFGCGKSGEQELSRKNAPKNDTAKIADAPSDKPKAEKQEKTRNDAVAESQVNTEPQSQPKNVAQDNKEKEIVSPEKPRNRASLGDLLKQPADSPSRMIPDYERMKVDDAKATAEGIRKLEGKRITLYTDVDGEEIDRLPAIFDQAFPQYCEYFGIDPASHGDWRATGFLMKDKERFDRAGLIPKELPDFEHGYSWNYDLWLFDQKDDYYRRHLLIHEGVHSFMNTVLGACGSPWYMEGLAEMLGTHASNEDRLTLNYFPQNREEVPGLGRIRIIRDDVAAHRAMTLPKILDYPPSAHHSNDAYAWSWAAAMFLDAHPQYQKRFRALSKDVLQDDFNANFRKIFADDLPELFEEFQVFAADMEYGYDIPRTTIDLTPGKIEANSNGEKPATATVAADRGWQNSGIRLEAGKKYEITASGRWTKKCRPAFWSGIKNLPEQIEIEPGGISIRYYHGLPLGVLLAAVRPDAPNEGKPSVFLHPTIIGLDATLAPEQSGTLFYRINDTAADLQSNAGEVKANIRSYK
jgi:hypothetical protein